MRNLLIRLLRGLRLETGLCIITLTCIKLKKIDYTGAIPRYELENIDVDKLSIPFTSDYNLRNWNIQDAKDGDVLVYQNGDTEIIMIFKSERDAFHAYTHFQVFNNTYEVNNSCVWCIGGHPATKEQCAFLFQKMNEAGYEWDAEKKQILRIDNYRNTIEKQS